MQFPTSLYKDYFMRNDVALSALLWFVLAKDDSKLLKQQLFNDF